MMRGLFKITRDQRAITEAANFLMKTGYKDAARQLILREIKEHPESKQMRSFLVGMEKNNLIESKPMSPSQ